ncbi:hypothetical protein L3V86_08630 [Thiotrichales bacterium 19S11-10]|nr:hypothetical protein [Thiotrichales bacterium 19S11-10]
MSHNSYQLSKILNDKILRLTITDCKIINNLIYCSYGFGFWGRMHNNQSIENFKLPSELEPDLFNRFSYAEKELILACSAYNSAKNFYKEYENVQISKVTMGAKIGIMIKDINNEKNVLSFELDQRKFGGLVRKYRSDKEIRLMIRHLFIL